MKFLIVIALVLLLVWLARGGRRSAGRREPPPTPVPPSEDIVACSHCGLHLPRSDALPGEGAILFCSEAHRVAFEQARR